uniref:Uncharacterized protein n=1 Tax=Ditylenchus dipsaci TaxID=166011 RepID=A0A915E428_9BILA
MGISLTEYYRHKQGLKKSLAAKSREQMKRRHSFFNMENEIVDEHDQSEEEEEEADILVIIDEPEESTADQCSIHSNEVDPASPEKEADEGSIIEELSIDGQGLNEKEGAQIDLVESVQIDQQDSESVSLPFSCSNSTVSSIQDCVEDRSIDDDLADKRLGPELGFSSDLLQLGGKEGGASQELFNEALTLCSGTFDLGSDTAATPTSKSIDFFSNNDLFTVDDDVSNCEALPEDFDSPDEGDLDECTPNPKARFEVRDLFDDEASHSGGEKDSEDENGQDIDEYEEEANDEQLPSNHVIEEDLARQYIKQKNDEEERRLRILMNRYLPDGELHTEKNTDRSFRFRMRSDVDVDWSKILGAAADMGFQADDEDEEEIQATQVRERKIEMMKWRIEQASKALGAQDISAVQVDSDCSVNHSLLNFGENIAKRMKVISEEPVIINDVAANLLNEVGVKQPELLLRDSLLKNASVLGPLLRETSSRKVLANGVSSKARSRALFLSDDATKGIARKFAK